MNKRKTKNLMVLNIVSYFVWLEKRADKILRIHFVNY